MDTESLLPYLREVAREAASGSKSYEIARYAEKSAVTRFLNAETKGWPSKIDEIVKGCADYARRPAFSLWEQAFNDWVTARATRRDGDGRAAPFDLTEDLPEELRPDDEDEQQAG